MNNITKQASRSQQALCRSMQAETSIEQWKKQRGGNNVSRPFMKLNK